MLGVSIAGMLLILTRRLRGEVGDYRDSLGAPRIAYKKFGSSLPAVLCVSAMNNLR